MTTTPKRRARQQRALGYLSALLVLALSIALLVVGIHADDAFRIACGAIGLVLAGATVARA